MTPHAASVPTANDEIACQCSRTSLVAVSLIDPKSSPTKPRQIVLSGSGDQAEGADRYFATLPANRMKAQSALAVLQADNRNTVAIRSGPSGSSMIASDKQTYFSDRAAREAPAEKKRESVETPMSRRGASDKVGAANIDVFP